MPEKAIAVEPAAQLEALGQAELDDVRTFIGTMSDGQCGALMLEVTRCLDHTYVMQLLSIPQNSYLTEPDFSIICRGWNVVLGLLLPRLGRLGGVPATGSSPETQHMAISLVHAAGRYAVLTDTAERVRHGLIAASSDGSSISLAISDLAQRDLFHDLSDRGRLSDLRAEIVPEHKPQDPQAARTVRAEMADLTFRWEHAGGVMVGYTTNPTIDKFFSDALANQVLAWKDEAGIHPDTSLPGCDGGDLMATASVLLSFYLKHIMFVEEGRKRFSDVNHQMSLTLWRTRDELVKSLEAAGSPAGISEAVIDLLTVRGRDAERLLGLGTPLAPMLIEISKDFLLLPASAVFQNPFENVRLLREASVPRLVDAVRIHRENWMAEDLYRLFAGTRFQRVSGQAKLASKGNTATDIDAAVFDWLTGELVLFQLKWQDFTSASLRSRRSKAKNFATGVETWGARVTSWIDDHGVAKLCQTLQIKLPAGRLPSLIRLWGVGRSSARFESLGYPASDKVLTLSWPQLVRLRHQVGSGAHVFEALTRLAVDEARRPIEREPVPYEMPCRGMKIVFKDIWSIPSAPTALA